MKKTLLTFCLILAFTLYSTLNIASTALSKDISSSNTQPIVTENVNPNYPMIFYSQLKPWLDKICKESNRVSYKVVGQSAGGRDLFEVVVSDPSAQGKLGRYKALRNIMMKDPAKAQEMVSQGEDFKVPIFINNSIHGGETTGVDAAVKLIEELAYGNSDEVQKILANDIIIFNLDSNPDGRINGWRQNDNGFDCNRDMATQSQPETKAILDIVTEWKPMIMIDNHGYVDPILIEPCGKPHNPNYEDDIYQEWALKVATTMEKNLKDANWLKPGQNAIIPIRDTYVNGGWDDYPTIFIPQLTQYYALTTQTIEVGPKNYDGVTGHYIANKTAFLFAAENRKAMFSDQIEIFKRGTNLGGPSGGKFPFAYVIPTDKPLQKNPQEVTATINYLIKAGIDVNTATQDFVANGKTFPKGTYVIQMNQPLAGLANALLWKGEDIEKAYPEVIASGEGMYDIAAWNFPELWGFDREIVQNSFAVKTAAVNNASFPAGYVDNNKTLVYSLACDGNEAIKAVNELLAGGVKVYQSQTAEGGTAGSFFIQNDTKVVNILKSLAKKYGLTFTGTGSVPENAKVLKKVKIAALTTNLGSKLGVVGSGASNLSTIGPMAFVLKDLGFEVDVLWPADLSKGLNDYDVIVGLENVTAKTKGITADGWSNLQKFFANGGKYVGYGKGGADFGNSLGILVNNYIKQSSNYNAIVNIDYDQNNAITGSYQKTGTGFVYGPLYFNTYGDAKVIANYSQDVFMAGYWLSSDRTLFAGKAAAVKNDKAVIFGLDPIFRAHIKDSFRLAANSIYSLTAQK